MTHLTIWQVSRAVKFTKVVIDATTVMR